MPDLEHTQDRLDWLTNYNADLCRIFADQLSHLLTEAKRHGVILSIELVPTRPLAMGQYMVMGHARLARAAYQEQMALEQRVKELKNVDPA